MLAWPDECKAGHGSAVLQGGRLKLRLQQSVQLLCCKRERQRCALFLSSIVQVLDPAFAKKAGPTIVPVQSVAEETGE